LKSKYNYILYIANDGKTANNYMFQPLKRPTSGCTLVKRGVQYTMYLLSDDKISIQWYDERDVVIRQKIHCILYRSFH